MAPFPDLVGNEIAEMTDFFERTKNPAAAWRAYSLAQIYTRPVPRVIQAEVDRFAACVSEAAGKVIQNELDLLAATSRTPKENLEDQKKKRTANHKDRIVNFRAKELYAAWRGKAHENPVGQLQIEWRDIRIFGALQSLTARGVRPGRARQIVKDSGYAGLELDQIEKIWKRLKTKLQKSQSITHGDG
ncbi:hypothetical protein V1294_005429 [Bradyrhizobium sp. AZCC 1678]|uniref:hypothetical protein n=1 Tax=Bradyrhizobium sp. AZCC 1678 TaxID=3117030 RepID=UPI002FF14575